MEVDSLPVPDGAWSSLEVAPEEHGVSVEVVPPVQAFASWSEEPPIFLVTSKQSQESFEEEHPCGLHGTEEPLFPFPFPLPFHFFVFLFLA